ncbi:hypothetical protein HK097_010071 [Rhizophlyctis rosea]|uniref:DNA polymerase epsilon catalytic subunit n=1 Tax=Rhizophlyctis rosea TaxID=64517 RepID=A0AAD5X000_9FUNG|nr:hypothetical protein HK097_010071 [Rhizophlyctis rosea]
MTEKKGHLLDNHLEDGANGTQGKPGMVEVQDEAKAAPTDESQVTPATFNVLKAMVKGWVEEVRRGGRVASLVLEHFYRWLTVSSSRLYDPALYTLVHQLMHRLFLQLLAEFKRFGSDIVFASFDRLVIATSKRELSSAIGYARYVIDAIQKKPIFGAMELRPAKIWDHLYWMDPYNHGGLVCENPDEILAAAVALKQGKVMNVEAQVKVDMAWNIGNYLPPAAEICFLKAMTSLMAEVGYAKRKAKRQGTGTLIGAGILDAEARADVVESVHKPLLKSIRAMPRTSEDGAWKFPFLPGSHMHFKNPALEFIKSVIHVLSLNTELEEEVRDLRRRMLRVIDMTEFNDDANFVNPCAPFRLPQVICEFCNYCRDLDLTRDRDLLPKRADPGITDEDYADPLRAIAGAWSCPACRGEYDRSGIEQRLVDVAHRRLLAWQEQDLKCGRCRSVLAEDLRPHCPSCSGQIRTEYGRGEFVKRMKVFGNIAKFHRLEMLGEVVGWIVERDGWDVV